jgi:hypothetical protein
MGMESAQKVPFAYIIGELEKTGNWDSDRQIFFEKKVLQKKSSPSDLSKSENWVRIASVLIKQSNTLNGKTKHWPNHV